MLVPGPMKQGKMGRKRQTSSLTPSQPLGGKAPPPLTCCAGPLPSCLGACYLFWLPLPLLQLLASAAHSALKLPGRFQTCLWNAFTWGCLIGLSGGPWNTPDNEQWHSQLPEVQGKHFSCWLLSVSLKWGSHYSLSKVASVSGVCAKLPSGRHRKCQKPDSSAQRAPNQLLGDGKTKGVFLPVLQPGRLPGHATCSVTESCAQKRPALGFIVCI